MGAIGLLVVAVLFFSDSGDNKQPPAKGSISGEIVNGVTGDPVRGAEIDFFPEQGSTRRIVTDARGHFEFKDLAPGRYRLNPQKTGFLTGRRAGAVFSLDAGQVLDKLKLTLLPQAVISGSGARLGCLGSFGRNGFREHDPGPGWPAVKPAFETG